MTTRQRNPRAAVWPLVCVLGSATLAACASAPAEEVIPTPVVPLPLPLPLPLPTPPPPIQRELIFLGTTDVHNWVYPYDYYSRTEVPYGLARLKPIIDSIRAANRGRTFLFDSGDLLQGNPLGYVYARLHPTRPHPVIKAMNLLRYDAAAIGNHEYNYGLENLNRALDQAHFPFLSANTFEHGTDTPAFGSSALISYPVADGDTIKIGVTANTPPGVEVWDRANVSGKLQFKEIVSSLGPVVAGLKERGADVIVLLSHGTFGGSSYDTLSTGVAPENAGARIAREIPNIDVVFLGHSHQEIADTTINGMLFTQAGEWGKALAQANVTLERQAPNEWRVVKKRGSLHHPNPVRADTAFLDSLRWEHERAVEFVSSVVGRASARMEAREGRTRDTPIADFINEIQRQRTGADLASTAVFRLSAALPAGAVTVSDVAGLYPYDNTLKAVRITGEQLKAYLEQSAQYFRSWPLRSGETLINPQHRNYNFDVVSGVDYVIDLSQPVGQRITQLVYQGQPVRPDQTFTLALNNYRESGGGGFTMLAGAPVVYDRREGVRETLIEAIQKKGTIRPQDYFKQNWRIVPEAAARAAQAELARDVAPPQAAAGTKRLRVLGMNDFHGRLLPEEYNWSEGRMIGGAAAFAAYLEHERAGFTGPTIAIDGGDVMQGTPLSNLTEGRSTIDFYNRAGIDAAALGNHDFDWTVRVLRERMRQARFPWLSANIYVAGTDTAPSWVRRWAMLEREGVKIGVIGLSTETTPTQTKAANVRGLEFRSGADEINRLVPELRRQGADFVIVTAHSGIACDRDTGACRGEMLGWAKEVTNKPDLIVAGHTHQIINLVENGIRIVEGWDYSKKYSVVDLEKSPDGKVSVWVRGQPTTFVDQVKPDSAIAAMVRRYEHEIGPRVNEVIAELATALRKNPGGEYALGHLITDAQRAATGTQIAIMNNGGIRTDLEAGPLTWRELYQLQPFANRLVKLTLTGAQVKETLETVLQRGQPSMHVSGITVTFDASAATGSRISRIALSSGELLRPDGIYSVTVNDFMADGGDGLTALPQARTRVDTGIVDLDALIAYLRRQRQPLRVPTEKRFNNEGTRNPGTRN